MSNDEAPGTLRRAMQIAGEASVETARDGLALFAVSFAAHARGNQERARRYLRDRPGLTTIADTPAGKALAAMEGELFGRAAALTREQAIRPWMAASERLVMAASGNVTAFVEGVDARSTFARIELPALVRNGRITSVNGVEKQRWLAHYVDRHPGLAPALGPRTPLSAAELAAEPEADFGLSK